MRLIDADDMRYEAVALAGDDEVVQVIVKDDVDASPTIRCGDCKHWRRDIELEGHRACREITGGPGTWTLPGFGCALFERRSDD